MVQTSRLLQARRLACCVVVSAELLADVLVSLCLAAGEASTDAVVRTRKRRPFPCTVSLLVHVSKLCLLVPVSSSVADFVLARPSTPVALSSLLVRLALSFRQCSFIWSPPVLAPLLDVSLSILRSLFRLHAQPHQLRRPAAWSAEQRRLQRPGLLDTSSSPALSFFETQSLAPLLASCEPHAFASAVL